MNRIKKHIFLVLIVLLLSVGLKSYGQDSHLSMYYSSLMTLNPAYTGMFRGYYRMHMHYRSQWSAVTSNPYHTANFSYEAPYKKRYGYGGCVSNHTSGIGHYNELSINLSGAYKIIEDPRDQHRFYFGVQLGMIQKTINLDKFSFNNQYDKGGGGSFDINRPSGESYSNTTQFTPNANFGVYYALNKIRQQFNPYGGAAIFHLTQPKEKILGNSVRLPRRYVVHGGAKISTSTDITIDPGFLFMKQLNNYEIKIGALGRYNLKGINSSVSFGVFHRTKDAVIVHTGFEYGFFNFRLCYDINTSSLKNYSQNRGGIEFSITYTKRKGVYLPSLI